MCSRVVREPGDEARRSGVHACDQHIEGHVAGRDGLAGVEDCKARNRQRSRDESHSSSGFILVGYKRTNDCCHKCNCERWDGVELSFVGGVTEACYDAGDEVCEAEKAGAIAEER